MRRFDVVAGTALLLACLTALPAHASDGAWRITETHADAQLFDVAAIGDANAWAVGAAVVDGRNHAVVRHWDGTAWQPVAVPASVEAAYLDHVAASSDGDVWITGSDARDQAYTLHWDGTTWQVSYRTTFEPGGDSIAVLAPDDVWLLGRGASSLTAGSARHFDGTAWTTVPIPGYVDDVSVVSAQDIWATGLVSGSTQPLAAVMHWNGQAWSTALTRTGDAYFDGVQALGATDVWVTGQSSNQGLTLHWNGTTWTSGTPATGVRKVGQVISDGSQGLWAIADGTRLLSYRSGAWSIVPLPQNAGTTTVLSALALVSGSADAWGVGTLDVAQQGDLIPTGDATLKYGG